MPYKNFLAEPVPDPDVYWRERSYSDFYSRGMVGPAYHPAACLLLALMGDYSFLAMATLLAAAAGFSLLWWLRRSNHLPSEFSDELVCEKWSRRQWALIKAKYLLWALIVVVVAFDQRTFGLELFSIGMLICIFGNAGSTVFTADALQQRIALSMLHWPAILGVALIPEVREFGVILVLHWLWCQSSATRLAGEYRTQIDIEHALLVSHGEIQALAQTDALTGLANRREYQAKFQWACNFAQRNKSPLALVVIDLDHFKAINDKFGHAGGDACLKHVAGRLRHHFRRAEDFVARIGGEEFVAVLPSTTLEVAFRLCEEFRLDLEGSGISHDGHLIMVTASIGVGEVVISNNIQLDENFARIDAAAYQAKSLGRNRTIIAEPAPTA